MSTNVAVDSAERRSTVTCYNVGTNGAIKNGDSVQYRVTGGTNPLIIAANLAGATAGTVTYAGGVALASAATGGTFACVVLGAARVTANATFAHLRTPLGLTVGTAGIRGRVTAITPAATAGTIAYTHLGYNLTCTTAAGQEMLIMVNPSPLR